MKIAYFISERCNYLGGADNTLLNQALLIKKIYDVIVVIPCDENGNYNNEVERRCKRNGLKSHLLNYKTAYCIRNIDLIQACIDAVNIDRFACDENIDFFHSVQFNMSVEYVSRKRRIPHLMNIYPFICDPLETVALMPRFISSDAEINCKLWKDYLHIDSQCVRNYSSVKVSKKEQNSIISFCVIGTICEHKNQLEVIKAFHNVTKVYRNIKMYIAGYIESDYASMCTQYVRENNLTDCIEVIGFVGNIEEVLKMSDAIVCGSRWESFPSSIVEALANDLTIISTPVGGITEIFIDGKNSYIVDGCSAECIQEGMMRFLEDFNSTALSDIKKKAQETYLSNFSETAVMNQMIQCYRNVMNRRTMAMEEVGIINQYTEKLRQFICEVKLNCNDEDVDAITFMEQRAMLFYYLKVHVPMKKIYVWGAGHFGGIVQRVLKMLYEDNAEISFVDKNKKGVFQECAIITPADIRYLEDVCVLLAYSGYKQNEIDMLVSKGYVENKNLFTII